MGSSIRKVENHKFCIPEIIPGHYLIHLDLLYPHITIGKKKISNWELRTQHEDHKNLKASQIRKVNEPGMVAKPSAPALGRHRQADLHEVEPIWSTRRVPGQPRLQRQPCLKNKQTHKKTKRPKTKTKKPKPKPKPKKGQ